MKQSVLRSRALVIRAVLLKIIGGAFALGCSTAAHANFTCVGTVNWLGVDSMSQITLSNGFGVWYLCSLANTGGDLERCKAWYAGFLAAQRSGSRVRLYFSSSASDENGASCTGLGSWAYPNPAPYFIEFLPS